ncbi:MAG: hypothetical protein AAFO69_00605 [Bacteroidota bacterium]
MLAQVNPTMLFPDQIYLQTTNVVYAAGKTMWFKARVTDATTQQPATSGVLYVELISPLEEVVEQKVVKILGGAGSGFFELSEELETGSYLLRAYTRWNVNFGTEYIYRSYINIVNPDLPLTAPLIERIIVNQEMDSSSIVTAYINEEIRESIVNQSLTVLIDQIDHVDTLQLKRRRKDKNTIRLSLLHKDRPFTIKVYDARKKLRFARSYHTNKGLLNLQFFPENGQLISGIPVVVAVKATDGTNNGIPLRGKIVNHKDETVATFNCSESGFGNVYLPNRESDQSYKAQVSHQGLTYEYQLPKMEAEGTVLSARQNGNNIFLVVNTSSNLPRVLLSATAAGTQRLMVSQELEAGQLATKIAGSELPYGVILFKVADENGKLLAHRYYFNHLNDTRSNVLIETRDNSGGKRAEKRLVIDAGKVLSSGNASVLVLAGEELKAAHRQRAQLSTYLALSSHFKKPIDCPGYYLGQEKTRRTELDALLLTMTPADYWYQTDSSDIRLPMEVGLNVSGTVRDEFTGKEKAGINLVMMTLGDDSQVANQVTDEQGQFYFRLADHYQSAKRIILQSSKKKGVNKNFDIDYDEFPSPAINYNHEQNLATADSVVLRIQETTKQSLQIDKAFKLSSDVTLLDEFVVEDYQLTPQREAVIKKYGKPKAVIDGDEMVAREEKWMFGLYSLLRSKYDDQIIVYQVRNSLYARVRGGGLTLVIVDGKALPYDYYGQLAYLKPSDISSVDIIKGAKNFVEVAQVTFPYVPVGLLPVSGSLIAIYTRSGRGFFGLTGPPKGINHHYVSGFSPMKIYQTMTHVANEGQEVLKPDLRAVLHWEPNLSFDQSGKAALSFYNSDLPGEVLVILEGIDKTGKVVYEEFTYEVE